ncbi:hypothetical protein LZ32DRAFT_645297 [Colletotrichum eremochloae]|nr:hypothetical protein LZ32DRAFT_645297 [Colletotrichum eremochloae]
MTFSVVITPNVPADKKDEFLAKWPKAKEDLSKQPGVVRVAGGPVVNENGNPVTEFKFVNIIVFNSAADEKAFAESAWVKEHEAEAKDLVGGPPRIAKFETGPLPAEESKPFVQFTFLELAGGSKHDEAKQAWEGLADTLGQTSKFGGNGVDDLQSHGLGVLSWNSEDEAVAAYHKPEAQAALEKFKALGKSVGALVKLEG